MASTGYNRPQNRASVFDDDDDEALDVRTDSSNPQSTGNSGIKSIQGEVQEVVGVMKQNIDRLLDRDVALNNLVVRADDLQSSATAYNQTARQIRRKYWWSNMKTNFCIGGIIVVVLIIIILSVTLSRGGKN